MGISRCEPAVVLHGEANRGKIHRQGEQKANYGYWMSDKDGPFANDDGLVAPEVGAWAADKHRLVSLYSTLFSSGMKTKWSKRTYVELYAGAGQSRVRGSSKLILGSPILALTLKDPFDKYVFCEEKKNNLDALKIRAERIAPKADISYVQGDWQQADLEDSRKNSPWI
jgi:hypothetical protein